MHFYLTNGSLVGSYTVPVQSNQSLGIYAIGNTTGQSSSSTFDARSLSLNGAGIISVGNSGGSVYVSATQSNQAASGSNGSFTFQTLSFGNLNGFSFYTSNGSIVGSYTDAGAGGGISAVVISAGTTNNSVSNFSFANSNGVSFGINGSTITGSHNGLTTAAASDHSHGNPTLNLTNLSGTTASNSNGFTLSLSAAAPGGGGGGTATMWWPFNEAVNVLGQQGQGTLNIIPLPTPAPAAGGEVEIDRVVFPIYWSNASNSTGSATLSYWMGLYTKNASTLSLAHSTSYTVAHTFSGNNSSASYNGIRIHTVPWTTTIGDGRYYVGIVSRTTSGGANGTYSQVLMSQLNSNYSGVFGAATNASDQWPYGFGIYSATTSGMPGSIAFSQMRGTGSLAARPPSWFMINGTV